MTKNKIIKTACKRIYEKASEDEKKKILKNHSLKRDHKPGMWDSVSHKFFVNAGTGEFIVGRMVFK